MSSEQPMQLNWLKSSYSSGEGGACVEFATDRTTVHIRDSKAYDGPRLAFAPSTWAGFVAAVGRGRSD
ncbi:DUF397 domain-containing protein [Streptomyces sp. NPDC059477]|uniref:DUF397 domain-containing protein n=1 Tax=Streptomyces sp. NPDC059477 TaxID=3346847 RepID=UPI0036781902